MLDILRNGKKAVRNMALNKEGGGGGGGSDKELQALEIWYMVLMSKIPLGVGANCEFMEILLRNRVRI